MKAYKVYHADVGFPPNIIEPSVIRLRYTQHAKEQAIADRYGDMTRKLPVLVHTKATQVVEKGVSQEDEVVYLLLRFPVSETLDLCLATHKKPNGKWDVATVWANKATDQHFTLNKARYECPHVKT